MPQMILKGGESMGIKRGVSLYSYQQAQFFKQLDWKAQVKEVREGLGTDGIEIIDQATIRDYPFPSEEFCYDWRSYLARYNMKAVTMDVYLDVLQFRDHVMSYTEGAERLKNDLHLAKKLGFANVRCLSGVPVEVIEMALPTAEELGVRIGKEIHAPNPIRLHEGQQPRTNMFGRTMDGSLVEEILSLADRTGSKFVGLVPDFGIFQHSPSDVAIDYVKRHVKKPEAVDFIRENCTNYTTAEIVKLLEEKYPDHGIDPMNIERMMLHESSAVAEDLREIVPYIVSMHGKFYHMTEIPGQPGHYHDASIDYETPIRILNEEGFTGYIDSEYEGQRDQQDRGKEYLPDEVEEVRRHHEMLQRLFDATPNKADL